MDTQCLDPHLLGLGWQLDLPVEGAGPEEARVEDIRRFGGGDDPDGVIGAKAIKLAKELEHDL